MSKRLETKWGGRSAQLPRISALLIAEGYRTLYPARRIFSIYYDDSRMGDYWRGEEGVVPRRKHRVRWYHALDGYRNGANYEIKISGVEGRLKYSGPVNSQTKKLDQEIAIMCELIADRRIKPLSLVSYVRRYFGHESGRRFTVDHDITYRRVHSFDFRSLVLGHTVRDDGLVVEMKSPYEVPNIDFGEQMPMTRTRFSKYSRSLQCLNWV
jgi:hypothetical protein